MDNRFTNSDRFVFCRNKYTGNMQITDLLEHFEPVELSDELAEVLSQILWEHTQLVNEKKKGLFDLNNLRDFVKKNNDLDKEIIIALINKGVERE